MLRCDPSGWATRHGSAQASGGPRLIKVERRRQKPKSAPGVGRVFLVLKTLRRWGARYNAEKARSGLDSPVPHCKIGSRILRRVLTGKGVQGERLVVGGHSLGLSFSAAELMLRRLVFCHQRPMLPYSTHEGDPMKALFWFGLLVLVLGIASLFVAIPRSETEGVKAGNVNIGVQVRHNERVSPIVSAVLILSGAGMMIAGGRGRAK